MLGALPERPAIRLLAHEGEHAGLQVAGKLLEPFGAPGEVACPEVARAGGRAVGRIRDADPEWPQLELLRRIEEAGRETGRVQQAPEVVAGIREVGVRRIRVASGIDAAEDDTQAWRKDVRDRRGCWRRSGYAASGSRASRRASNASRIRSVNAEGDSAIKGSPGRTTLTVSSLPLWP